MSITLKEAKDKIELLEQLPDHPEMILTTLFQNGIDDSNFLYQVNIDEEYILDYLIRHLLKLDVFRDVILKMDTYEVAVYIPVLKFGEFAELVCDDLVMEINLNKKTFRICNKSVNEYEDIMNKEYKLEICELSDFWKGFENFTFTNRMKRTFSSVTRKGKSLHNRVIDFFFLLFVPRRVINKRLAEKKVEVCETNDLRESKFKENIALQNYYKEHAPKQIELIQSKQKEISKYLINLGYKEDIN